MVGGEGNSVRVGTKGWVGSVISTGCGYAVKANASAAALKAGEAQAVYGGRYRPWWDVVGGVRQDFKPGDQQNLGSLWLQGMAIYNFEAEATLLCRRIGAYRRHAWKGDYWAFCSPIA